MGLKRAATVGLCPTQHKKHVLLLLVASLLVFYFAKPVLFRLNDLKARDGADGPLQIALAWLKQSLICESEVKSLCWTLRPHIDAAFHGDRAVMAQHIQRQLQEQPAPPPGGATRGIVISVGGGQFAANAFVNIYVLQRHLKCTLPVAMMYWGSAKQDALSESTIKYMKAHLDNVQFIDASALPYPPHQRWLFPPNDKQLFNGWKVKVFALYAAPFDEVLLLDGDSTPFRDVTPLFDHPSYRAHGNLFWADPWCKPVRLFRNLGVSVDPWRDGRELQQTEAGQILFNRHQHRDVLEWLLFLNTHDEFTYYYAYGDKDTYRAAFMLANKTDAYSLVPHALSIPLYHAGRGGGDMLIQGLFHHHPDGGLMFLHRAGVRVRKYSLKSGAGGHPISHLLLQPSCELATRSKLWNPTLRVKGRDIITRDRCDYDLSTAAAAREACGLEPESGLRGSNNPTVFEITQDMPIAQVQAEVDVAFNMLREHIQEDPTLFR